PGVFLIGFAAMIFSMLQCSFFIYYQVSFIKASGKETVNRVLESVTEEDKASQDSRTLFLQKVFQVIYGWQDLLIYKLDKYMIGRFESDVSRNPNLNTLWYKHKSFLTMASILSIGSHMVLIAICAAFRRFEMYLFINLILMNLLLILCIIYKYTAFKKLLAIHEN